MMSRRFLITILTLFIIGLAAAIAIFLAKGYTFSPKEGKLLGTGIISVTSIPDAASVFVDGHLTTATNANISGLAPKIYKVKVLKEGFIPWEKEVSVKEGLVTDLKATLFPSLPTIYPLTFSGVKNPILSHDGSKLAFIVPKKLDTALNKKSGVWVWTFEQNQPIAFARGAEPHQIADSKTTDFTNSTLSWSPDSKQILVSLTGNNYLLDDDRFNSEPRDITAILASTQKTWEDETKEKEAVRVLSIKDLSARKIASSSAGLKWAPDETKFMYGEKVYDLETNRQYDIVKAKLHFWLPTSKHIVLVEEDKISVVEYDGSNKATVFAGKFEDNFVFAWPDASRLVMISSFPTPTASEANLYGINLK